MFEFKFLLWALCVFVFVAKIHNLRVIKYYYSVKKDGGLREVELAHEREMRNSSKTLAGNLKLKD
jgi:hypothetical protein